MNEYCEPLPQEMPAQQGRLGQSGNGKAVGLFVAYNHHCLHAVVVQRISQPVCSNGSTTRIIAGIDYKHSHTETKVALCFVKTKKKA